MEVPMSAMPIASAPCSFGVDEILVEDAWMPGPDEMLDWMLGIGYAGTELGPPAYLGQGLAARERLERRNLELVGAFLPQHFSRADRATADRDWFREQVGLLKEASPEGSQPFAVLCEAIDEPDRLRWSGRIEEHPEAQLDGTRFQTMMDNMHRAGELAAQLGLRAVIHPHAGTYLETDAEIERMVEALDANLVGLCLDTGHFRFGGADPAQRIRDYHAVIRHVHIKDCYTKIIADVKAEGKGLHEALFRGVFTELGNGDSGIEAVVAALREIGYEGWLVVEQDQFLRANVTREALVAGQRRNLEYLRRLGV
jgi:inosose dehydratase